VIGKDEVEEQLLQETFGSKRKKIICSVRDWEECLVGLAAAKKIEKDEEEHLLLLKRLGSTSGGLAAYRKERWAGRHSCS